jgi:AAA ATPase domain
MWNRSGNSVRLIGRADALAALRVRNARAARGLGGLILVGGEAGLGKTALCEQLVDDAATGGFRAAWAECRETAVAPPLWPWSQLLRQLQPDKDVLARSDAAAASDPRRWAFRSVRRMFANHSASTRSDLARATEYRSR